MSSRGRGVYKNGEGVAGVYVQGDGEFLGKGEALLSTFPFSRTIRMLHPDSGWFTFTGTCTLRVEFQNRHFVM